MKRNMFEEALERYLSPQQLARIQDARILIAGCGGLGSNIATILVRTGFVQLTLMDFDVVEPSNLNRQGFFASQIGQPKVHALRDNLLAINPSCVPTCLHDRLTPEQLPDLLKDCTIVVEAFDGRESKAMLVNAALTANLPVVCASGIAGYGNSDAIHIRRMGNAYTVGDFTSDIATLPPLAPRVTVAAAKQADLVLELVLEGKIT